MRLRKKKQPARQRPQVTAAPSDRFAYYSRRSPGVQPNSARDPGRTETRSRKSMLRSLAGRFGAILAFATVLLLLIGSVQLTMKPRVVILNKDKSVPLHTVHDYQNTAEHIMKSSWTNTNKLTIDTNSVGNQMRAAFPEVADVSMALPLIGQRPVMYLQLTVPQIVLANPGGQAYIVDENGRALVDVAQASPSAVRGIPTVTDDSGIAAKAGKIALAADDVQFVKSVLFQLEQAGIPVGRLVLLQGGRELDVYIAKQPYFIKFNLQDDKPKQQVGTFLATHNKLKQLGNQPKEYIDVRLAGRAYYK